MYEVYLDGDLLYYPGDNVYTLEDAQLQLQLSQAGELTFTVPATNPKYSDIHVRQSMVQVVKNGKEIFYGEVRESEEVMDGLKSIYAVGELAFLYDSIQPQGRFQNITPAEFFSHMLDVHNGQVDEKKRFLPGIVTVVDTDDSIFRYTNREDTLTDIRDKLCDRLDGYLRIRKENGLRYLDLITLNDYGKRCAQPICFGENLLDYNKSVYGNDIATVVIPTGAMLDESPIEALYAYTDITSVNDGKDYLELPEAIERFGRIVKVVQFENIKTPSVLKRKGTSWLEANQFETLIIEADAVDLSMIDANIDEYDVGDYINLQTNWNTDIWLPLRGKTMNLLEPEKDTITIGYSLRGKLTDEDLKTELNALRTSAAETALTAARKEGNLISGASGGYIVIDKAEDGTPARILIMDAENAKTAKNVIQLNKNGIGFSTSGIEGPYRNAWTIDGNLVADFITAGKLVSGTVGGWTISENRIRKESIINVNGEDWLYQVVLQSVDDEENTRNFLYVRRRKPSDPDEYEYYEYLISLSKYGTIEMPKTMQSGTVNVTPIAGEGSETVTFPVQMAKGPKVTVTARSRNPDKVYCSVADVSENGFTVHLKRTDADIGTSIDWIAVI